MAAQCDIRDHHVRCEPHLARLQMAERYEVDDPIPPDIPDVVARATSAVLAEAQAAGCLIVTAIANGQRRAVTTFLDARLGRLAAAAGEAVTAAEDGNDAALRRHLRRFQVLTSALWTVQLELSAETMPPSTWRSTPDRSRLLMVSQH